MYSDGQLGRKQATSWLSTLARSVCTPCALANSPRAGGTNLRVCLVTLEGEGKFEITQTKYRLTEEQKQEDGQKLFDFCAECLKTFVDTNLADENSGLKLEPGEKLPLGFTVRSA
jgi:hexokinase